MVLVVSYGTPAIVSAYNLQQNADNVMQTNIRFIFWNLKGKNIISEIFMVFQDFSVFQHFHDFAGFRCLGWHETRPDSTSVWLEGGRGSLGAGPQGRRSAVGHSQPIKIH